MPRHARRSRPLRQYSSCTALIFIDASARRKKERALYRRRTTELERETERLKAFEEQDVPDFSRWIEHEFGAALEAIREAATIVRTLGELQDDVRAYAAMRRLPLWRAYRDVEEAREAGTLDELFRQLDERARGRAQDTDDDLGELLREFASFARETFGVDLGLDAEDGDADGASRQPGGEAWSRHGATQHTTAAERDADSYLKSLYRQLVRALHPDSGVDMTAERQRLWCEVQDAYSWGDVHRLARLHAEVCEGRSGGGRALDLDAIPIGDIMSLRRTIEQRLRAIRAKLKEARQEPAWGFSTLLRRGGRALARLRFEIDRELRSDLAVTLAERLRLERIVEVWKRGPKPQKERQRRPDRPRREDVGRRAT
jgi:hypothetical protein